MHIPLSEAVFPGEHVDKEKNYVFNRSYTPRKYKAMALNHNKIKYHMRWLKLETTINGQESTEEYLVWTTSTNTKCYNEHKSQTRPNIT